MTSKAKKLALTIVAALAIAALVAPVASAEQFTAYNETTNKHEGGTVEGVQVNTHQFIIEEGKTPFECEKTRLKGTSATGTDPTLTLTPEFELCSKGAQNVIVEPNGCRFLFHITGGAEEETEEEATREGTVDVKCPGSSGPFQVLSYEGGKLKCRFTIEPQVGAGPVYYENRKYATTDIDFFFQVKNLLIEQHEGGEAGCGTPNGTYKEGIYKGVDTLRFYNGAMTQLDYTIMM